jgi:hypothetical protein
MLSQSNIDHIFMHLLSTTGSQPDHGRYPNYQEDDQGVLWEYTDTLTHDQAMAVMDNLQETFELAHAFALPQEGYFTLMGVSDGHLLALYASAFQERYYVIQADGNRYYQWLTRRYGRIQEGSQVQQQAYDTLRQIYGVSASSLPLSRMTA